MTEEIVKEKLDLFAKYTAQEAIREFKPTNAVSIPGIGDERAKKMASGLFQAIEDAQERTLKKQYGAALNSINGNVNGELDDFLGTDPYYLGYEGSNKDKFRQDMRDRLERLADGIEPVVNEEKDDFWGRVEVAYSDREEAMNSIGELFSHHKVITKYRDGIVLELDAPVVDKLVEYTDESLRSYRIAETRVWNQVRNSIDKRF